MEVYSYCVAPVSLGVHYCTMRTWMHAHYCLAMLWRVMHREKNKFEVLYTHEAEHNMEMLLVTQFMSIYLIVTRGPSCSHDIRIKHYLCNKCISPLTLWVWITIMRDVDDTTLCHKVWQWLGTGRWFFPVSSTNKINRHDIPDMCLKMVLHTTTP